jgi:hypothetical protein
MGTLQVEELEPRVLLNGNVCFSPPAQTRPPSPNTCTAAAAEHPPAVDSTGYTGAVGLGQPREGGAATTPLRSGTALASVSAGVQAASQRSPALQHSGSATGEAQDNTVVPVTATENLGLQTAGHVEKLVASPAADGGSLSTGTCATGQDRLP